MYQRFQIVRIGAQTLLELLQSTLESAAFTVGDLEISARNAHALVQRQCARERDDRFLGQPFAEIEDAKVVVRAGVRGIDSTGERAKDVDFTAGRGCQWAGSCRCAHGLLYSHRAKNGVECLGVGNEQEESVQTLRRLLQEELGFNAQNRRFNPRRVIAQRAEREAALARGQMRRRKHQPHVEKLAERRQVGAGQDVSGLVQR